ncbi:MAG: diadenylate cyclase [Phycisphaerae bacterium]
MPVNLDTLYSLFERLSSGNYAPLQVLIELVLIGVSVNWCADVLHGTRGTRLLRGVLVMLIAATLMVRVLAAQFGWERLDLLYRYFVTGLAFIALVAFQPELRRALIRAGEVPFLRRSAPRDKVIGALVEATGYLSRNRFGALIAVQRDVALGSWAENGTPLHAEVSANLLKSIFFPNSALHDLGVILRGNRVVAAGCQFPVAESGDVDPSLGSRHRAAVGLSLETDALVLVVSEETGTISLADGGHLVRYLSLDDLEGELEARLGRRQSKTSQHSAGGWADWWRVARRLLIVIPLTLVIWYMADLASLSSAEGVRVELRVAHDPLLAVEVVEPVPSVFRVDVRGSTREIAALRSLTMDRPLPAEWSLPPDYKRGRDEIADAKLENLIASCDSLRSRGVLVDKVTPRKLTIAVDEVEAVAMPVRVQTGAVRVVDVRTTPAEVVVYLRHADLERIPAEQRVVDVELGPRLEGVSTADTRTFDGVLVIPRVAGFTARRIEPQSVSVTLRVEGRQVTRRLDGVTVSMDAVPQVFQRYAAEIQDQNEWLIQLEVVGEAYAVESLRPQDVRAFVRVSEDDAVNSEFITAEVTVLLPPGAKLSGPPPTVRYRLVLREGARP